MHTPNGICKTALSVQGCQPSDTNAPNLAPGLTLQNLYGCTITTAVKSQIPQVRP